MTSISFKRITSIWIITILILFVVAILLGITMRLNQGNDISVAPNTFYSYMTAHGLTMIGIWAAAGMVGIHYLLSRYMEVSSKLSIFAFVTTVIGVVLMLASTLLGQFHAGWTFLYPLPFYIAWDAWATPAFLISLTILSVSWLIWNTGMLMKILKKYPLKQAFAWQHLSKKEPSVETPPFILISTVSLVGMIVCFIAAVILLALLLAEYFGSGSFTNDPLLIKNLTYFFGHTVANEALYLGLAALYELMPEISGRPKFKTTWYVALGWNCTMVFILTAFFHHLYMDFVQPEGFQIIGQLASYFASVPAAAVTVISVVTLIFNRKVKWSLPNILFLIGVMGWMIGGIGALIDSTISNNAVLHNTLWVPAHFHTYNAMGNVLFALAFFSWVSNEFSNRRDSLKGQRILSILLLIGGFGFVLAFYLAGADSVPRRFSNYPEELSSGPLYASMGAFFATIYLVAMLWMFYDIIKKCTRVFSSSY